MVSNPEFLREGSALRDFFAPPFTVVGSDDGDALAVMTRLYAGVEAPLCAVEPEAAELLKYVSNAFHALKVVFGNEIGALADAIGVDSRKLMETFVLDTKLNVSPRYLMPGFAFGGSCLGKDVRGLCGLLRAHGVSGPLLGSIVPSNEAHLSRAVSYVSSAVPDGPIGVAGLVFKAGTNDFRESPYVYLVRDLLARGREVRIYEPMLAGRALFGANRQFMAQVLPQHEEADRGLPGSVGGLYARSRRHAPGVARRVLGHRSSSLTFFGIGSFGRIES